MAILWIWLNPRAFSGARDDTAWVTKAVIGERFWTNRHQQPVPDRHRLIPHILNIASLLGFPLLTVGLITLQIWPTAMGILLITGAKLWYLDRMVMLYEDMVSTSPQLAYRPSSQLGRSAFKPPLRVNVYRPYAPQPGAQSPFD